MNVVLLGATGLVGGACLTELLVNPDVTSVRAVSRRPLTVQHAKLDVIVSELENLTSQDGVFQDADALICCVGSTRKQAGSRQAFKKIDFHYCLHAASLAREQGVAVCLVVSALGASVHSPSFYLRVKGELEQALTALRFPVLSLFQPSLLLGQRASLRLGESLIALLVKPLNPLLLGVGMKYRAISADTVGRALVAEAVRAVTERLAQKGRTKEDSPAVNLYTFKQIVKLSRS